MDILDQINQQLKDSPVVAKFVEDQTPDKTTVLARQTLTVNGVDLGAVTYVVAKDIVSDYYRDFKNENN